MSPLLLLIPAIFTMWITSLGVLFLLVHWPIRRAQVKPGSYREASIRQREPACDSEGDVGSGEVVDPWLLAAGVSVHSGRDLPSARSNGHIRREGNPEQRKACGRETVRVLLVIAHPDDESMFFVPLLACLATSPSKDNPSEPAYEVHVLCLSNGNAGGLGATRSLELRRACRRLGISKENVRVVDHPALQDGFSSHWPTDVLTSLIQDHAQAIGAHTLVSFDSYGVSGHPNHQALLPAIKLTSDRLKLPAWTLVSVPLWRKFLGALPAVSLLLHCHVTTSLLYLSSFLPVSSDNRGTTSRCTPGDGSLRLTLKKWVNHSGAEGTEGSEGRVISKGLVLTRGGERMFVHANMSVSLHAMRCHASQWVWFRWLFVLFSHYTFANTLSRVTSDPNPFPPHGTCTLEQETSVDDLKIE